MNSPPDLKQLEQRAYRSTVRDGITEISLGLIFLAFGFAQLVEMAGLSGPWNILILVIPAFLVAVFGKLLITRPRAGRVAFGPRRKIAARRMIILGVISTTVLVVLVVLTAVGAFPARSENAVSGVLFLSLIGLAVLLLMLGIAWLQDLPHLVLIGVLVGISVPVAEVLYHLVGRPWHFLLAYGTAGIIILAVGVVLFLRFIRAGRNSGAKPDA